MATTIDAWCARTGREVNKDSLWLFRAPEATGPAPELHRGIVTLGRHAHRQTFYTIVWDTEHGHVIYLQPLDGTGGQHKDGLAVHAAELIEPRWWADAVVVMPIEQELSYFPDHDHEPMAYLYRLTARSANSDDSPFTDDSRVFGGLRRWFQRNAPELAGPPQASAEWAGQLDLADVAKVVGRLMPVWLNDTETSTNAEQTLSYDRTFVAPDTVTDWPATEARLTRAIEVGLPRDFPCAFAALTVDAAEELEKLRAAHQRTADSGPGWYLVCRPARPAPSFELEQQINGPTLVTDTELVGKELAELRTIEGELDIDDQRGDAYAEAIALLQLQLRYAAKAAGTIHDLSHDYVPVADDGYLRYSAPWGGPVVDAWLKTLTPVEDLAATLRLRRVRRIIRDYPVDQVRSAYRDSEGRYILRINLGSGEWSLAEWPVSLQSTSTWTDKTVLAGDDELGTTTTLLALTPADDGQMRVDPVPLPPRSDRDAFAYGYGGGTPGTTYQALLRCALGDDPNLTKIPRALHKRDADGRLVSQLWAAISTTKGPLRLSWPQLKMWARADKKTALTDPKPNK
ncbi:hypothetical protein [Saccharopolyspora sp. NPDC049357]|uniref:hypothetical protein n=1 Tax=Saccharopolyspora sp. NPDC049357 TaxID=3154507 RepID=UPI00341557AE